VQIDNAHIHIYTHHVYTSCVHAYRYTHTLTHITLNIHMIKHTMYAHIHACKHTHTGTRHMHTHISLHKLTHMQHTLHTYTEEIHSLYTLEVISCDMQVSQWFSTGVCSVSSSSRIHQGTWLVY